MGRGTQNHFYPAKTGPSIAKTDGNVIIRDILGSANRDLILQQAYNSADYFAQTEANAGPAQLQLAPPTASRSQINSINFAKPVNRLVHEVAQAIGESARRMQPRSLQRTKAERADYANANSETHKRPSKGGRAIKGGAQAAYKNTLLHRIAQITLKNHSEITENQ